MYVNAAATTLIGRSASELLDQPLDVLVARAPTRSISRVSSTGRAGVGRSACRFPPRRRHGLEIKGARCATIASLYLLELRDVSELQALADAVRRHEIRHLALARLTSDVVYYLRVEPDCRMVIEWSAGSFANLIGYSPAEIEAWVAGRRWSSRLTSGWCSGGLTPARRRGGQRRVPRPHP